MLPYIVLILLGAKMAFRITGRDKLEIEPDPATWTALEEKLFIQLMVREVHEGNRSATTFSRKGWKHIEQEFCEKTNKRYNNSQFRNKFNQLRTRYLDFSRLLKEPGFSWDPVLNTVTATDALWESYIKYPMVGEYKLDVEDESTNATPSAFPSDGSNASVPSGTSDGKWVEITKATIPTFHGLEASPQACPFSITNCVKCLEAIEGVDGSTYLKAIKMFKDVDWREMFMAMSAERRLVWLANLD
ncbi:hypothetical protein HYC85_031873 [Camellia sinensis]|uniref:Myb/SANT-like domain-containing protein n=1 Tax=Camellia sinensis TaxID=4442 RepID=A0A7J7FRN6_CAMSI|nr:hypothetical protein HYC85_031873 [Camellia sinensis]